MEHLGALSEMLNEAKVRLKSKKLKNPYPIHILDTMIWSKNHFTLMSLQTPFPSWNLPKTKIYWFSVKREMASYAFLCHEKNCNKVPTQMPWVWFGAVLIIYKKCVQALKLGTYCWTKALTLLLLLSVGLSHDLQQFCLFNKNISKLGTAEWMHWRDLTNVIHLGLEVSRMICPRRESNPGLRGGRRELYKKGIWTT